MNFSNLKEWVTPRGKVKELAINGKIAWKSHTHSYTAKVTAPTCTAQGYTTYTCSCGDSYKSDYKAATGHKYGAAYLSSEFSTGYGQKCSACGHRKALTNNTVSARSVGSSLFILENGVKTEFIVVHQGTPDTTLYDGSCNGTWLLRKNACKDNMSWDSTKSNVYKDSTIHAYLNNEFLGMFTTELQSRIKQVKIPHWKGNGQSGSIASGSSGLSAKIFLLSAREVGWTNETYYVFSRNDGSCLSYFVDTDTSAHSKRTAFSDGSSYACFWWIRTPYDNRVSAFRVMNNGGYQDLSVDSTSAIRPAFILPSDTLIDGTLISKT